MLYDIHWKIYKFYAKKFAIIIRMGTRHGDASCGICYKPERRAESEGWKRNALHPEYIHCTYYIYIHLYNHISLLAMKFKQQLRSYVQL